MATNVSVSPMPVMSDGTSLKKPRSTFLRSAPGVKKSSARRVISIELAADPAADVVPLAPLLCAGLIGWRSLKKCGEAREIGLYGFGAAAHIITQICKWQGRRVYALTRKGDLQAQSFARKLGAIWSAAGRKTA